MTDEEMRHGYEQVYRLEAEMRAESALLVGGRLHDPAMARVVRPAKGRVRMTDGPFAETKEHLGGFYVIEAPDAEAALAWASRVALLVNAPIEVRAFVEDDGT
jgi:hypothetical protein